MSQFSVEDEIVNLIKTIPHVDVHEGQMSDEKFAALLTDSNQIKPFVTVSFGGLIDPRRRINGIAGAKTKSYDTTFVVRCVGTTDRISRQVRDLVKDKVLGFVPTNCGEIDMALFGGTGEVSSLGNPTRYASVQAYRFILNSDYDGSAA